MLDNIDYLYDEFVSWSEEFILATKERKKMIICKLFKSIKIGKGYNVEITLNLDYEQFLNGIKNEEPIAIQALLCNKFFKNGAQKLIFTANIASILVIFVDKD